MSSNKSVNPKMPQYIAEEAQLLAEEKWIIETLRTLREQRNSLQIERLHLENQRAQLLKEVERETRAAKYGSGSTPSQTVPMPRSNENITLSSLVMKPPEIQNTPERTNAEIMEILNTLDNDLCNAEELNLAVTNPVFANQASSYEIEEDDEDMENCVIEMNMFMNGELNEN